ncbi:MAG: hypothetical protein LBB67_00090, partial [Oscillospiraceae bacterium]|nr:hypothetical protein [Oscillospiraceae bacterium]
MKTRLLMAAPDALSDARAWLDRQIGRIADYAAAYAHTPGRTKNEIDMAFGHLNGLFNVDITANNGIAELLVR